MRFKLNQINWRSIGAAVLSVLTILAALPYTLGDLATIIPPAWKPKIVLIGLIGTIGLRVWNSVKQPGETPPTDPPKP